MVWKYIIIRLNVSYKKYIIYIYLDITKVSNKISCSEKIIKTEITGVWGSLVGDIPHQRLGSPAQLQTPHYSPKPCQRPQHRVAVRGSFKPTVRREIQAAVCGEVRTAIHSSFRTTIHGKIQAAVCGEVKGCRSQLTQAHHRQRHYQARHSLGNQARRSQGNPGHLPQDPQARHHSRRTQARRHPRLTQGRHSRGKQARQMPGNPNPGSLKAAVCGTRKPADASGHLCAPWSTGGIWGYELEPSSRARSSQAPPWANSSSASSSARS